MLRNEFDGDRDIVRPNRDGGLPRHPLAGVGAAARDARARHRPGRYRHDLVRRGRDGKATDLEPGDIGACPAVLGRSAGDVHGRSP